MKRAELPATPVPVRSRGLGWPAFLLAVLMVGALAHVAVRLHGLELAYDLARQRKIQSALEEQRRRLQTEIGMLKDPTRIVALARDRLQMGPPRAEDIRRLARGVSLQPAPVLDPSTTAAAGRLKGATSVAVTGKSVGSSPSAGPSKNPTSVRAGVTKAPATSRAASPSLAAPVGASSSGEAPP